MPGFLLTAGASVQCAHAGIAQTIILPAARVKVLGQPVVPQGHYQIAACVNPPPPANTGPCLTATWMTGALRVKVMGVPLLLQDSQAICTPTGTPLTVAMTQTRVKGI